MVVHFGGSLVVLGFVFGGFVGLMLRVCLLVYRFKAIS